MKNLTITALSVAIDLGRHWHKLDSVGLAMDFLNSKEDELFNAVLDEIGFLEAGTPFQKDDVTLYTSRDYLQEYFYEAVKNNSKSPEQMLNDLIEICEEEKRYGDDFDISPWMT